MADMLVKLYELDDEWHILSSIKKNELLIRKPIGPEKHLVVQWIKETFYKAWASEADCAISNSPTTLFVAIAKEKLIGFSCYDATALGFFGPIGVDKSYRKKGIGKALLLASLFDMKQKGYGYAIIPTDQAEFYQKAVGAVKIPGSAPGIYKTFLRPDLLS